MFYFAATFFFLFNGGAIDEALIFSSSDLVGYPSSDSVSSEEEIVECWNRPDKVMEKKKFSEGDEGNV